MIERHRILIVYDDAIDRRAVARALGREADVLEVDTVARAREALQGEEFSWVFVAHTLPDGTSLELLTELRARGLATPVVVLTGQRDEETIVEMMKAGVVDSLPRKRLHPDMIAHSLRAVSNGIVIADPRQPDCPMVYVNEAFLRITGYTEAEVVGRNCRFLQGPSTDPAAIQALREAIRQERACQVLIRNYRKDGAEFWNEVTVSPVRDEHGVLTHFVGVQTDVTEREDADIEIRRGQEALRASEEALRESEERLRDAQARLETALSAGGIATWTWDVASDHVVADANLASLFSVSPEDAAGGEIGVYLQAIYPNDRARVQAAIEDALAHRDDYEAEYRVVLPDGSHRWLATRGRVERDAQGLAVALPGVVLDITEQAERGRRERFLANLAERTRTLTDPDAVIADAVNSVGEFLGVSRCVFADIDIPADTTTVPPDYRADDGVISLAGTFPISAFGPYLVGEYEAGRVVVVDDVLAAPDRFPPDYLAAYEAIGVRAFIAVPVLHSARLVSLIGVHSAAPRDWMPEDVALLRAVVERTWLTVEVLRQQRALAREAETTARVLASITDAFFTLDRDWRFVRINEQAERLMTRPRAEIMGLIFWEAFPGLVGTQFEHEYRRAIEENAAVTFQRFYAPSGAWLDVRAFPSEDGLSVFFQDITERKSAEAERERLLTEQQSRAEREALLNRIGQTIRSAQDPNAVQAAAVSLLGEALGADRCYFALYDLGRGVVNIAHDWHRVDLPSVQGIYPFGNTAEMFRELYGDSNTSVVEDAHTAPLSAQTRVNMEQLQLRSRVSVALAEGDSLMATLTAAMADGPREWTGDEVALVEAVGTQLRTAVEAARVAQREHNIATQLQAALQPALPERVHDLSVGNYTRPALDEAQVGGDFFDIFPLDKELYALVIGDVSGKGLAAAQQLALIRNSLRTALYLYRAPAQAVAAISAIVSAHDLLVGFVTAWVGIYDAATGRITYASCGHEPGMVKRGGTGKVELLVTTGPPLGLAENATYGEEHVTLGSGDALLLYTDGISEAGPSRRDLLGTVGLTRLFEALPDGLEVQSEAKMLVAQVSDFAGGVFRDDVAVLLTRRK